MGDFDFKAATLFLFFCGLLVGACGICATQRACNNYEIHVEKKVQK